MGRPRTDEKDPLRRLLRSWRRGDGVEPEHRDHLVAVCRVAVEEADSHDFSPFEQIAAAMVVRLYGRSLASPDAITTARCLGEVTRSLRSLKLLGTEARLGRSRPGPFSPRRRGGNPFRPQQPGAAPRGFTPRPAVPAGGEDEDDLEADDERDAGERVQDDE